MSRQARARGIPIRQENSTWAQEGAQPGESRCAKTRVFEKETKRKTSVAQKNTCEAEHIGRFQLNTGDRILF